jgi:ABC-type dipeptide/oligopeptide/nickel transport system permease subunit
VATVVEGARRRERSAVRRVVRGVDGWASLTVVVLVVGIAVVGPWVAPHSPTALLGSPFQHASSQYPLGTDYIGEDVLSRLLSGGRTVIAFGFLATALAYLLGGAIGLFAGFRRGAPDSILMRCMDVLLAFPPIIFLLMLGAGFGNSLTALVLGIATVHVPSVARIVRTAALEASVRGFVEAAMARGDSTFAILRREVLPNIFGTVVADAGPRFTVSVLLVAAVNFLGLGIAPPQADWALMISENRPGITVNAWSVVAPALMIGILTVSLNVFADSVARALGTSADIEAMRR